MTPTDTPTNTPTRTPTNTPANTATPTTFPGQFAQGCYTGNGNDNRNVVTGLSFQPALVSLRRLNISTGPNPIYRPSRLAGDNTCNFNGACNNADEIQALNSDGFQVGQATAVNTNGQLYCWYAWSSSYVGTYTGVSGNDDRSITGVGFAPDSVIVWMVSSTTNFETFRTSSMSGDLSCPLGQAACTTNSIQALEADGFQVGTTLNQNGVVYDYVAAPVFTSGNQAALHGTYTGDSANPSRTISSGCGSRNLDAIIINGTSTTNNRRCFSGRVRGMDSSKNSYGWHIGTTLQDDWNQGFDGANAITDFSSASFVVTNAGGFGDPNCNFSSQTYYWIGWCAPP